MFPAFFDDVRKVKSAKGPDSSFGGVPVGNCLDVDHIEEEVQVRVQVAVEREEQRIGETHGKEQSEEQRVKRTDTQTHHMDDHGDDMTRSCRHLSQCGASHIMKHVRCAGEKVTCDVYLSTDDMSL